jgi:superfamily II DNA/RNA helicase
LQETVEKFGRDQEPVRVLITTDIASEGINLHFLSHKLIHFDPRMPGRGQDHEGRSAGYGRPVLFRGSEGVAARSAQLELTAATYG